MFGLETCRPFWTDIHMGCVFYRHIVPLGLIAKMNSKGTNSEGVCRRHPSGKMFVVVVDKGTIVQPQRGGMFKHIRLSL